MAELVGDSGEQRVRLTRERVLNGALAVADAAAPRETRR